MVNDMDTAKTKVSTLARHIGFLFQNPDRQICQNTVRGEKTLRIGSIGKKSGAERRARGGRFAGIRLRRRKGARSPLSRGERQRVALASIVAASPEILLLDEPTTGLDYRECMHICGLVKEMNRNGVTVVMVCHDMEVVLDFAQRVLVMASGRLLADGETADIFRRTELMRQASLAPPQIIELAIRLGKGFEEVNTVSEMVEAVGNHRRRHERNS
jgi:energy-coupling factor transport system ATP-binding protein